MKRGGKSGITFLGVLTRGLHSGSCIIIVVTLKIKDEKD